MVEFAVVVILLLILVFGILEFAFTFYQRHFVENGAREGMRVGVRADNFNCFNGLPSAGCTTALDRKHVVEQKVTAYLSALYQPADILLINVERIDEEGVMEKSLKVTVTVKNFFPQLLSGLVPGFVNPDTITYHATGRYEDPDEYDDEE